MSKVYVVGIGPGGPEQITPQARAAMDRAEVLCGYTVYLELVKGLYPDKEIYTTPMRQELERCRWALETAQSGRTVALLCSGDPGVYGMAGPLLELAQSEKGANRDAVLKALSGQDGEEVAAFWEKELQKHSQLVKLLEPSNAEWAIKLVTSGLRAQLEKHLNTRPTKEECQAFNSWCWSIGRKDSPAMLDFWKWP